MKFQTRSRPKAFCLLVLCVGLLFSVYARTASAAPVFREYHDKSSAEHQTQFNTLVPLGYRMISLSVSGDVTNPRYAAVWVQRSGPAFRAIHDANRTQFTSFINTWTAAGYQPTLVTATGPASAPIFAGVFEQRSTPTASISIDLNGTADPNSIQARNLNARAANRSLAWAASYGDFFSPRYAAIWIDNPKRVAWNADGIADGPTAARDRMSATLQGWARPSFVTVSNIAEAYLSVYRDDYIGPWQIIRELTKSAYETQLSSYVAAGFLPIVTQAGGTGAATRYAVIFAKQEAPSTEAFTVTGWPSVGTTGITGIDNAVQQVMTNFDVHGVGLAVVQGKRLVMTRGYTLTADPAYPITQPTTLFRTASCAKNITAALIETMSQSDSSILDSKVQDILQLRQPNGSLPFDSRFSQITVRQLLAHTSGLTRDSRSPFDDGVIAFANGWTLPLTQAQLASYMMTRADLFARPVGNFSYSNFGYDLLGLIIENRLQTSYATALQTRLLTPLKMKRTRVASSLPPATADEARYHDDGIASFPSVLTPARTLAPVTVGWWRHENYVASGDIAIAPVDFARILAMYDSGTVLNGLRVAEMLVSQWGWDPGTAITSTSPPVFSAIKGGVYEGLSSRLVYTNGPSFILFWNTDKEQYDSSTWNNAVNGVQSAILSAT